eukprot:scaffold104309_cov18-Tisochrysis_lutea.AAC.1
MSRSQKHGWNYFVAEPNQGRLTRQKRFTGYGDNFRNPQRDMRAFPGGRSTSTRMGRQTNGFRCVGMECAGTTFCLKRIQVPVQP